MSFVVLALLGCVPKGKLVDEQEARQGLEARLRSVEEEHATAQRALAAEAAANAELTERAAALDANNATLREELTIALDELGQLATRNEQQASAKASLEARLTQLQADAEAAYSEAEEARARAEALAAERDRLRAEKQQLEARTAEYDQLVGQLKAEIDAGQVTITELSGKLTVNMSNAILFDSGSTAVKPAGREALTKVAAVLAGVTDRQIQVEGHTDDVPVAAGAPYGDNWGLSALRATNVVSLLVAGGVDARNVAAVGYGEHHPAAPNDTKENRATNRRTEIVLAPRLR